MLCEAISVELSNPPRRIQQGGHQQLSNDVGPGPNAECLRLNHERDWRNVQIKFKESSLVETPEEVEQRMIYPKEERKDQEMLRGRTVKSLTDLK